MIFRYAPSIIESFRICSCPHGVLSIIFNLICKPAFPKLFCFLKLLIQLYIGFFLSELYYNKSNALKFSYLPWTAPATAVAHLIMRKIPASQPGRSYEDSELWQGHTPRGRPSLGIHSRQTEVCWPLRGKKKRKDVVPLSAKSDGRLSLPEVVAPP